MSYFYGWISVSPPALYHSAHEEDIGNYLPETPITRFVCYMWHSSADQIEGWHRAAAALRPNHTIHHLVNDAAICRQLVVRGVPACFVNHNAFIDECRYTIQPGAEKRFNAVYTARMSRFKRHQLAAEIPRLSIVGGTFASDDEQSYFDEIADKMPNATFSHLADGRFRSPEEIAVLLNQANVGLCLSACEGAMYACTEYLLCGLPVVSTVSQGGRDAWLNPGFSRIVADDPAAIASAVAELASLKLSPWIVRNQTLLQIWEHRRRFFDLGQSIYCTQQIGREFARDFYAIFSNKCGGWRPPQSVMLYFNELVQKQLPLSL